MLPVRRNSKASPRLVLPLLLGPHTAASSPGRLRVCSVEPNARNPLIFNELNLNAAKALPHQFEPLHQNLFQTLQGVIGVLVRLNELRGQCFRLQVLKETITVAYERFWRRPCHIGFGHSIIPQIGPRKPSSSRRYIPPAQAVVGCGQARLPRPENLPQPHAMPCHVGFLALRVCERGKTLI
jgi:hypothetical protein